MIRDQIELLRSIGKHAFVLIYLVIQSRPVTVSELARDLDIHRETALAYLRGLAEAQAVTRTRYGWLPTVAGRQLVLPAPAELLPSSAQAVDNSVDKVTEIPPINAGDIPDVAEIPSQVTEKPLKVTEFPSPLIINKESLIKDLKQDKELIISGVTEKPPTVTENSTGEALRQAKVRRNRRTEGIYAAEHLTAEHILAAERHLKKRYGAKYSTGLLISMLETIQPGDKPAGHAQGCLCAACAGGEAQGYAGWEE